MRCPPEMLALSLSRAFSIEFMGAPGKRAWSGIINLVIIKISISMQMCSAHSFSIAAWLVTVRFITVIHRRKPLAESLVYVMWNASRTPEAVRCHGEAIINKDCVLILRGANCVWSNYS